MSKIKNGGLDQYGTEPFEQQPFGTVGVEGVNQLNKTQRSKMWRIEITTKVKVNQAISK